MRRTRDDTKLTKEFLLDEYVRKGRLLGDIAEEAHTRTTTIAAKLKEYGFQVRKTGASRPWYADLLTRDFLYDRYVVQGMSALAIAKEVRRYHRDISHKTIVAYLKRAKIPLQAPRYDRQRCGDNHPMWRGHGDISSTYWSNLRGGARRRDIPFRISIRKAWDLYVAQGGRCALTDRPIGFAKNRQNTASLDRIDPSMGYEIGNVQWVHKDVNWSKQDLTNKTFVALCREVVVHADNVSKIS